AEEANPPRLLPLLAFDSLVRGELGPVFAAAAQDAVETHRCDEIVTAVAAIEPDGANELRDQVRRAGRQVGVARVGAADVRTERAADAVDGVLEGELIESAFFLPLVLLASICDARNRLLAQRDERMAVARAADHGLRKRFASILVVLRLPVDELPESNDVLSKVAHHQIAAVAPEI